MYGKLFFASFMALLISGCASPTPKLDTSADAEMTFVAALEYACSKAADVGVNILIEPLNHYDAPGYFLSSTAHAAELITRVGAPNLKLMFDCYHVQLMEGDLTNRLRKLVPVIGHIQIARVPDRGQGPRVRVLAAIRDRASALSPEFPLHLHRAIQ